MPPRSRKAAASAAPPRGRKATAAAARSSSPAGADDVIVLSGPPGQLRATLSVENAVDQRVTLRGLVVHRAGAAPVTAAASALIAPGATADVPVVVRLDPTTPPGEHAAEVEVGGVRRAARLLVDPDPSVRITPRRMLGDPGSTTLTLVVLNDGNVPIPLAAVTRARTDDGGPDPGPDVRLELTDPPTAEPGRSVTVSGRITVPRDLDPTRRHVARIPVGTADLEVIVLPRTASETPS